MTENDTMRLYLALRADALKKRKWKVTYIHHMTGKASRPAYKIVLAHDEDEAVKRADIYLPLILSVHEL
jgi:hypothetical protein